MPEQSRKPEVNCHVISNTHWDREWRYPFQSYRMDLVEMMDRLLDLLEKRSDYRAFYLDSQTVILEDYLEIRPENECRIKKLVEADRLQIGPWYTLPDQWGCPGEALVRNLLVGHQSGRKFGPISKVGYTPFSNGQISQLPQLYKGFGIDSCFYYRGIGKHIAKSEFLWDGADGSRLYGFKFGDYARYNYYYLLYRPGLLGRFPEHRDYPWIPEEVPYHVAIDQAQDRQYGWIDQELKVHEDALPRAVKDTRKFTEADATTSELLYMMGHDHSFATEKELDLIEAIQNHTKESGEKVFHSSLNDYMDAFRRKAGDLQKFEGEMRHTNKEGLWTHLMAWILSCRLYLKQRNARVNTKVILGAEPLAACAWLGGTEYPERYLDIAWKKILVNQAHDAIGGCSVDQVHQEMLVRWNDVETISDEIMRRSMRDIVARIDGSSIDKDDLQLTVFNTVATKRGGVAEFVIDLPNADKDTSFVVETTGGKEIPIQIRGRETYPATIEGPLELTLTFDVERCRTLVELPELPAMGYEALVVKKGKTPKADKDSIVKSERVLENEFLRAEVNDNGTVNLTDKASGRTMKNLCYLEDTSEFGDPWNRVLSDDEKAILSLDRSAQLSVISDGPLEGAIRAVYTFPIPVGKGEGNTRSKELTELPVTLDITLRKGSKTLDITASIENKAKDHRLRMLFPTSVEKATHSTADGQFDILSRKIELPDATGWKEAPYPTNPMWNFVDISDGKQGMAVINDGLIEYEAVDDKERTIAITLLRAFGKFIYGRPTPGSQCLGEHVYRFAICPHAGDWKEPNLPLLARNHIIQPTAILSAPSKGSEPTAVSYFELSPSTVVFSAIKSGEKPNTIIVRFWNPEEKEQTAKLVSRAKVSRAELMTLEEIPLKELPVQNGHTIEMTAAKKKIITLSLALER